MNTWRQKTVRTVTWSVIRLSCLGIVIPAGMTGVELRTDVKRILRVSDRSCWDGAVVKTAYCSYRRLKSASLYSCGKPHNPLKLKPNSIRHLFLGTRVHVCVHAHTHMHTLIMGQCWNTFVNWAETEGKSNIKLQNHFVNFWKLFSVP